MKDEIEAIGARIERLLLRPGDVRWFWKPVVAPVARRLGRRPRIATWRLQELLALIQLPSSGQYASDPETARQLLAGALSELKANVHRVERTVALRGRAPDGYVRWLWRLYQVVRRAGDWVQAVDRNRRSVLQHQLGDGWADRAVSPLLTSAAPRGSARGSSAAAHVDSVLDAALAETRSLGRQRRLLEAARQLLNETAAALALDPAVTRGHQRLISRRIARLDRLEAAGVEASVDLGYQVREALERGEAQRLHALLTMLEDGAAATGDVELGRLADRALGELWGKTDRSSGERASLEVSQREIFGPAIVDAIERGFLRPEEEPGDDPKTDADWVLSLTKNIKNTKNRLPDPTGPGQTLSAAVAADGYFDVGAAASPVRVVATASRRSVVVRHPTQDLALQAASGVDDLVHAVVGDPRMLVPDLASGKLLARRYLGSEPVPRAGRVVRGEVRAYVLDSSGSMLGRRGRVRDALLVAELATLIKRWEDPDRTVDPILYFRYFTEKVDQLHRVAGRDEALAAIPGVVARRSDGGTDIQGALLASFEQIRAAARDDPDLASAQIVLVTDGEAAVDEAAVDRARQAVGALPIAVSIIALGAENPALRALAARQRAGGQRVFYQFIDDEELNRIVLGATAGLPVHLPQALTGRALSDEVRAVVGEIRQHLGGIDAAEIARAAELPAALDEAGLPNATALDLGVRARLAAAENDRSTLEQSFLRLFPPPSTEAPALPPAPGREAAAAALAAPAGDAAEIAEVVTALATVAEVVGLFGAGAVERQADAIDILERLLADAGVTPWRYEELVRAPAAAVAAALLAVHAATHFRPAPPIIRTADDRRA